MEDLSVIRCIGKGSFAKVMLVSLRQDPNAVFAMKVMNKSNVGLDRCRMEKRVLENLEHPFIVRLHQAFETSKSLALLLEYCQGGELFFHLTRAKRFGEAATRFYTSEIVLALEYLHGKGVIYRDLKPENVLLCIEGHVKITDFGICKEGVLDNTSAQSHCGTPEYYAPEMLEGRGHGRAVDWYTLGALAYEMLTGLPPYYSRNRDKVFERIRRGRLDFPAYVSSQARSLISSLMNFDPNKRLGGGAADGEEVRLHNFFDAVDWQQVLQREVQPPFRPQASNPLDTRYVDSQFKNLKLTDRQFSMSPTAPSKGFVQEDQDVAKPRWLKAINRSWLSLLGGFGCSSQATAEAQANVEASFHVD